MSLLNDALRKKRIEDRKIGRTDQLSDKTTRKKSYDIRTYFAIAVCAIAACIIIFCQVSERPKQDNINLISPDIVPGQKNETPVDTPGLMQKQNKRRSTAQKQSHKAGNKKKGKILKDKVYKKTEKSGTGPDKMKARAAPAKDSPNKTVYNSNHDPNRQIKTENIFYSKALTYQKHKMFKEAILMYRQLLEENPAHQNALFNIATCYLETLAYSEAICYLQRLKSLDNSHPEVLLNLAVAEIGLGRPKKALKYLSEAKEITSAPNFEICLYRGIASSRLEKPDEALSWYKKAQGLCPDHPLLLFNMAVLYDKQRQYQNALKYYLAFLNYNKKFSDNEKKMVERRIRSIRVYLSHLARQQSGKGK